ncbi:MAG TPA: class I SAM-dependent methyltransferase [Acidimicrobiales bacterium]|nr:class I SAM-dependent methyltransferase [Acidimicrobiales bacterium]
MNEIHLQLCASPEWATYVRDDLLPWALGDEQLGDDVLELGPGPGLTTQELRHHVARLTAVELDPGLASALAERLAGTNVEVICADATDSGLSGGRFSGVTCFTMLHHVPSAELQDRLFREVVRVLRPGGCFVGTDATDTPELRGLHVDDVFVPVDPTSLGQRLAAAGLIAPRVELRGDRVRFAGRRPGGPGIRPGP